MERHFLILTASQALYEQVEITFSSDPDYRIHHAGSFDQAVNLGKQTPLDIAILDTGLSGISFREIVDNLQSEAPNLRWLVLPPEEEGAILPLLGFKPDGYLTRPLDLVELEEQIEILFLPDFEGPPNALESSYALLFDVPPPDPLMQISGTSQVKGGSSNGGAPQAVKPRVSRTTPMIPWEADPERSKQVVFNLLALSGAQAAMILSTDQLLGFQSKLPARAKPELIGWVHRAGVLNNPKEMLSFVKLESTTKDHLIYVMPLGKNFVLTTVFDAAIPFKEARTLVALFLRTQLESESRQDRPRFEDSGQPVDQEYVIVLTPRYARQLLTGKAAVNLSEWIQQVGLIHNWQIKKLLIQPDHVTWNTRLTGGMSPHDQVKIVRHYTSIRLRSVFPSITESSSETDFWADEYIITTASEPLDPLEIQDLIQRIGDRDETKS